VQPGPLGLARFGWHRSGRSAVPGARPDSPAHRRGTPSPVCPPGLDLGLDPVGQPPAAPEGCM